ncbi:HK97-gp10 family putative phage morphogenesis protein [Herbaspirillum sp. GCM10030257]|uniref:HK97-gp10 family putative phage morphogenesis protein n=1 Tax=Herbaspirillum sp. GCM10030257 TaxID=3273393 RepID=UPI00360AA5F9
MMAEKVEGLAELRTQFASVGTEMKTRTARGMVVSAGGVLKREAKRLAQEHGLLKTGALINNIAIKREKTPDGIAQYHLGERHGRDLGRKAEKKLVVGKSGRIVTRRENDPFYWFYHEFGTKKMQARPYIAPALENKRDAAIEAMEKRLARDIEKANKK